jgi:hypothetical protein
MGLIDRIFGNARERESAGGTASTQFRESEPDSTGQSESRNAPRRELVQVILRDTMRKHGIPSDWVECRVLSTVTRTGRRGLHVNFVVKKAHEKLLAYVFAFQDSFERELARFEPRASDWLLSLGWEFQGFNAAEMPDPHTWAQSAPAPLMPAFQHPEPQAPQADEEIERDLKALFAIRDAALADTAPKKKKEKRSDREQNDFQPTQPFDDPDDVTK